MSFLDRFRGGWSLKGVARPWKDRSLFAFLAEHVDATGSLGDAAMRLPDEKEGAPGIQWAAGALDGVMGHHMGTGDQELRVKQVAKAVVDLTERATADNLQHLYQLLARQPVLAVMDGITDELRERPDLKAARIHAIGRVLAEEAPDREAVKFGIALLGTVQANDGALLKTLGAHEEFTLFTAVALVNQNEDPELELFELARRVHGWGRIQLVERLTQAQRPEVRHWLLREGFRNSVMDEYLAYTCAVAGKLREALEAETVDPPLLSGAAGIFAALARGGPAEDLADYDDAPRAIEAWLGHIEKLPADLVYVEALDALAERREVEGALRTRLLKLRSEPAVTRLIEAGLASMDGAAFSLADHAAAARGLSTFDVHEGRLLRREGDAGYSLFRMMQQVGASSIERALSAAREAVDLAAIGTGPSDEAGLGPKFVAHGHLDYVLQELGRFPGHGTAFLVAALRSPTVRARNLALRAAAEWSRDRWPAELTEALETGAGVEPVQDVKAAFERVLAGQPFDEPDDDEPDDDDEPNDDD